MLVRPCAVLLRRQVARLCIALFVAQLLAACAPAARGGAGSVALGERWEQAFTASGAAGEDTRLTVTLTGPGGASRTVDGFWDGGSTWRVRFLPDQVGAWSFRTSASPAVTGLHGVEGRFAVSPAVAGDRFSRHGQVGVAANGRHLAHADGTPFFWLGDTAWNGALLSTAEDWVGYLAERAADGFSVIQFVTTQWRTAYANAEGQPAYTGYDSIRINPEFFRRMDARVDAVNRAGMLAAPVLLWTLGDSTYTPGRLPEDQAIKLARYLVARYQGNHVVWVLAGDDNFERTGERWKRIGRAVFDRPGHAPVTLHPQGTQWHFDSFADEPWLSLLIYQSGHGDDAATHRWIHSGPVAAAWQQSPARPIINSEPNYEGHVAYHSRQPHTAYNVRRAVYWSLLNAPTAGVTYGGHGIWSWETAPREPQNHRGSGIAPPWHEAMKFEGSQQMKHVARLMRSLEWWRLRPSPALVLAQPEDPAHFVGAAATESGDLAVLYLPVGGTVALDARRLAGAEATWYDPRTGAHLAGRLEDAGRITAPDSRDWVLLLRARR